MAHKEQVAFCKSIKQHHPEHFINKNVLDVGSLDINGNNRYLFSDCLYVGVDLVDGPNVDVVQPIDLMEGSEIFDTIISTEMLEHDKYYKSSIAAMYRLLKQGGLILITCATTGRPEHGTHLNKPEDSPLTNSYYQNVTKEMLLGAFPGFNFSDFGAIVDTKIGDIYFWGIKKCL